jgi:hypothetical protein
MHAALFFINYPKKILDENLEKLNSMIDDMKEKSINLEKDVKRNLNKKLKNSTPL